MQLCLCLHSQLLGTCWQRVQQHVYVELSDKAAEKEHRMSCSGAEPDPRGRHGCRRARIPTGV